uniref:Putative secreted protein n=1 Tax=Ixodes ricinus TaxID=34613 RepID=A0A6B0UE69_IXORI
MMSMFASLSVIYPMHLIVTVFLLSAKSEGVYEYDNQEPTEGSSTLEHRRLLDVIGCIYDPPYCVPCQHSSQVWQVSFHDGEYFLTCRAATMLIV